MMDFADDLIHPVMILREDVLNFLEAIDLEPGDEMNKVGFKFARLLKDFHQAYEVEVIVDQLEKCLHIDMN
jgi:hypothetical protein